MSAKIEICAVDGLLCGAAKRGESIVAPGDARSLVEE